MNGGVNTYAYVGGNPVMNVDPLGLQSLQNCLQYKQMGFETASCKMILAGGVSKVVKEAKKIIAVQTVKTLVAVAPIPAGKLCGPLASKIGDSKLIKWETDPFMDNYWKKRVIPLQISPGPRTVNNTKISRQTSKPYQQTGHYDEYGRSIGRTDRSDHGYNGTNPNEPHYHPNPHHHRRNPITGEKLKNKAGSRIWGGLFGSGQ